MDTPIDLLQIKIDKAKEALPKETRAAIEAVDWGAVILGMREGKGYSFEQLGDLELETELLLCGLLPPENYPKELENRMRIPRAQAEALVNEMNQLVFSRIRQELIKNTERDPTLRPPLAKGRVGEGSEEERDQGYETREDILKKVENIDLIKKQLVASISGQKLAGSFQIPIVKTQYSLNNISKTNTAPIDAKPKIPNADPYRLPPE